MIRVWIATALLASSWMLGLDYFYPASPWAWFAAVAAAVGLLSKSDEISVAVGGGRRSMEAATLALLLPAVWFAPWPYRAAPLLLALGLTLQLQPIRKQWSQRLACGAIAAGVVMLVQALALELYASQTARSHELPWPLPDLLGGVVSLLGIDAVANGSSVVLHSMRQIHRLGATWELLLDPATFLFLIGGLTALALRKNDDCDWLRSVRRFALIVAAWLPLRAALMTALYLHRVLRSDPNRPLHAMNHFFSPWMLLLLLVVPVLLAWRFMRFPASLGKGTADIPSPTEGSIEGEDAAGPNVQDVLNQTISQGESGPDGESLPPSALRPPPSALLRPLPLAPCLIALAVALFTAAIYWNPVGHRREGRVMVVERHSQWELTTKPYDTTWYVEPRLFEGDDGSAYNYAAIYAYLGQFYQMSRLLESDKIDDQTLSKCDVLVIKIPTKRYSKSEAEAVVRFVEQGGGVLLIGDHTDFLGSSTAMNDITRPMGFIFRDDLLFSFDQSAYEELYERPLVPHPSVQHVPMFDFAVSCSIDPGYSRGWPIIASTGLWSMGPEYHADNYHPIPQHCPEMRYGAFVQAWAARHGQGRAIAFTDSTIFSNFCVFQPGKAELMLGMVEWLNHGNPPIEPRIWLMLLGLLPLAAGLWICRSNMTQPNMKGVWLLLLAAGTCGWVAASLAVSVAHRSAMPTPARARPLTHVVIDRSTSTVPLAKGMYARGNNGDGYGMLEAWIARLGCYTTREEGDKVFSGDVLVVICPNRSVSDEYREKLSEYVKQGGKLLVIDSPENVSSTAQENTSSTVHGVLWPFGMSIHHDRAWQGKLSTSPQLPAVDIASANEVIGGQTVARLGEWPVAAAVKFGKGSVMAVGFGSLWSDKGMGEHAKESLETAWGIEPDATVRARYDLLFGMLRSLLEDKPLPAVPAMEKGFKEMGPQEMSPKGKEAPDLNLKESGPAEL